MNADSYNDADFYTNDPEAGRYTFESPEEVIEDVLLKGAPFASRREGREEVRSSIDELRSLGESVIIYGFKRRALDEAWKASMAFRAVEMVAEAFSDEYGDPDGGNDGLTPAVCDSAVQSMRPLVCDLLSHAVVWQCERCGERSYSATEIETMMRDHCPEWFAPPEEP